MIVTVKDMKNARTVNGGYSKVQVVHAQTMFPGRWKSSMIGKNVTDEFWEKFVKLSKNTKNQEIESARVKNKILNPMSKPDGWDWKPQSSDTPEAKFTKSKTKKHKRKEISKKDSCDFYSSREWLSIRVRVLEKYECQCMMCGRSPKLHKIIIYVDHIKPRSKYPELSLDITNLQILCCECNKGKSNKYETDWRPSGDNTEHDEMALVLATENFI